MSDTSEKLFIPYFKLRTKPFEISPKLAKELAAILIEWGSFENAIIIDLTVLRQQFAKVRELKDELPRNFTGMIDLWKQSICTLFSEIPFYKNTAREICGKGKIVARYRNRLIHGHWRPAKDKPGVFQVISGFDPRQKFGYHLIDVKFAAALHRDIHTMTEATYSFISNRLMHAAQGLLVARLEPQPIITMKQKRLPPSTSLRRRKKQTTRRRGKENLA